MAGSQLYKRKTVLIVKYLNFEIKTKTPNQCPKHKTQYCFSGVVENEGLADRKVPKQPNIFRSKDSDKIRYNSRKLNELPYHLLRARRWKELFSLCLFNFEFLQAKLCCFPLQVVISDYEDAISKCEDVDACRQLNLVMDGLRYVFFIRSLKTRIFAGDFLVFRLSASLLSRYPWMFAFELLGRLLPLVGENEEIMNLLKVNYTQFLITLLIDLEPVFVFNID